jgi:hypothetical protein
MDNIDLVVLNRASSDLVYNVLRTGSPLKIADKNLYFDLLCKTNYEAMDWWSFVFEFYKIKEKARSFSVKARSRIRVGLDFLEEQFQDILRFRKLTQLKFREDRNERRNVEDG